MDIFQNIPDLAVPPSSIIFAERTLQVQRRYQDHLIEMQIEQVNRSAFVVCTSNVNFKSYDKLCYVRNPADKIVAPPNLIIQKGQCPT